MIRDTDLFHQVSDRKKVMFSKINLAEVLRMEGVEVRMQAG